MNIKKFVYIIIGFPDKIFNTLILKYRHVKYGKNFRINGRIRLISNTQDGIVIGNDVRINSSPRSNPIGGDTRTILFAKGKGKIHIGNGCGISNATLFACDSITLGSQILVGGGYQDIRLRLPLDRF